MDDYSRKPRNVKAVQWDGTRSSMYLIVGTLLSLNHEASIEDGYSSQGPDLINVQTREGWVKVYPKDYVLKDGAYLFVMKPDEFKKEFEKVIPPKPPVTRGPSQDEIEVGIRS